MKSNIWTCLSALIVVLSLGLAPSASALVTMASDTGSSEHHTLMDRSAHACCPSEAVDSNAESNANLQCELECSYMTVFIDFDTSVLVLSTRSFNLSFTRVDQMIGHSRPVQRPPIFA